MAVSEMPVAPARSLRQRMDALERANDIRSHRARVKRELRAGRKRLVDLFDDPLCASMKIFDALLALPKVGRVKANRILISARISPSKTLGGMTERQRSELCGLLPPAGSVAGKV